MSVQYRFIIDNTRNIQVVSCHQIENFVPIIEDQIGRTHTIGSKLAE